MNIESIPPAVKKASPWLIVWSTVTFICGILAVILPLTISFGIALAIGCLILIAGIAHLFFAFDTRSVGGFLWQILPERALCDGGNLFIGESTFERSFAGFYSGDFSPLGGHPGVCSLLLSQAIPLLDLASN
jgi:uncharacterized membrane protein HdeD (DUF308 family)